MLQFQEKKRKHLKNPFSIPGASLRQQQTRRVFFTLFKIKNKQKRTNNQKEIESNSSKRYKQAVEKTKELR
jgi:hypothetical protein